MKNMSRQEFLRINQFYRGTIHRDLKHDKSCLYMQSSDNLIVP